MVLMTVVAKVNPEKEHEFKQLIQSLHRGEGKEKGLTKSTLFQELNEPCRFHLIEEWESREDMENYTRKEEFRVMLGALNVLCGDSDIIYSRQAEPLPVSWQEQLLLPETQTIQNGMMEKNKT